MGTKRLWYEMSGSGSDSPNLTSLLRTSGGLLKNTVAIHCDERFVIIKIGKYLVINVTMSCDR